MFTCLFSYAKLWNRKGYLMSITLAFGFLNFKIKCFPVTLMLIKRYVADQNPQTTISFFPIYTKLCYRKRELMANSYTYLLTNSYTNFLNVESFCL